MISKKYNDDIKPEQTAPLLNGLVLAGGKSVRMGADKSLMQWHNKEQRYFMADLLQPFCWEVYLSCRKEQQELVDKNYKIITDSYKDFGPYGAILSAFQYQPHCAWLVVACDLPLIDREMISCLIENRNISAMATTFESPFDGKPEPLITIWEPQSYEILISFLHEGKSCPRKALINNDVFIIKSVHPEKLMNVNTQEDVKKVKELLNKGRFN